MDHQLPGAGRVRKRANKACLACRARKVRCDVSQRGRPCMNCFLDGETCVVIGRASRRRKSKEDENSVNDAAEDVSQADPRRRGSAGGPDEPFNADAVMDTASDAGSESLDTSVNFAPGSAPHVNAEDEFRAPARRGPGVVSHQGATHYAPSGETILPSPQPAPARARIQQLQWNGEQSMRFGSDVTYSCYSFLDANNLSRILPQDASYLEMQGCLRVPIKSILDDFIKEYFLHVHPIMPLLREGDFWEMYGSQADGTPLTKKLSLLVLQAMLLSACSYVPIRSLEALGFADMKAARAAFYRRAKLLFDLEAESSAVAMAQAALLLSSWSPPAASHHAHVGTYWLGIAIQQAKASGAHRNFRIKSAKWDDRLVLKRLWSCIILQDRIMSLCLRRPIQVTREHFAIDDKELAIFDPAALSDEVSRSRVYNLETKASLNAIFAHLVRLAVVLTDLLTAVWPMNEAPRWGEELDRVKLRTLKKGMKDWREAAAETYPTSGAGAGVHSNNGRQADFQHESVTLYSRFMWILYHSAATHFAHHESLHVIHDLLSLKSGEINSHDMLELSEIRSDVEQQPQGLVDCLEVLVQQRLSRYLPLNLISCISLPLILCIIDSRLSPGAGTVKYDRLENLSELVRRYQPQADIVDKVSEAVRQIFDIARLEEVYEPLIESDGPTTLASELGLRPNSSIYYRIAISSWPDVRNHGHSGPGHVSAAPWRLPDAKNLDRIRSTLKSDASTRGRRMSSGAPWQANASSSSAAAAAAAAAASDARDESMRQVIAQWSGDDQIVSYGLQAGIMSFDLARESEPDGGPGPPQGHGGEGGGGSYGGANLRELLGEALSEAGDVLEGNMLDTLSFTDQVPSANNTL